jgi:hypothetical protein
MAADRPVVPPVPSDSGQPGWDIAVAQAVNGLLRGKGNTVTLVTLTANDVTTMLVDDRIGLFSHLSLEPTTASAMTARAGLWYETGAGLATLHHASNAAPNQTFSVNITG